MKRRRVTVTLAPAELKALRRVRRYVKAMSGVDTMTEAIRFLVRDWEPK